MTTKLNLLIGTQGRSSKLRINTDADIPKLSAYLLGKAGIPFSEEDLHLVSPLNIEKCIKEYGYLSKDVEAIYTLNKKNLPAQIIHLLFNKQSAWTDSNLIPILRKDLRINGKKLKKDIVLKAGVLADYNIDTSIFNRVTEISDPDLPGELTIYGFILNTIPQGTSYAQYMKMLTAPNRFATFRIKKAHSDSFREISVPNQKLRKIHVLIKHGYLDPLWEKIEAGEYGNCRAFAYRKNMSYSRYSEEFIDKEIIYHFDLKNFFPSIRAGHIRRVLKLMGIPKFIRYLISTFATLDTKKLPQGTTISPVLSNIVGHFLIDLPMEELAKKYNLTYARYSDDLNFGGTPVPDKSEFFKEVASILFENKFRLNRKKTKVSPASKRQVVLSHVVNKKLSVPKWQYSRFKAIVHNCLTQGFTANYERFGAQNPAHMYYTLFWKLNHYATSTGNKRLYKLLDTLKEAARIYPDEVNTIIFGDPCTIGTTTSKIYVDGFRNKNASGHMLKCSELGLDLCVLHRHKNQVMHAELKGLLEALELVQNYTFENTPEILTDSHAIFVKLLQKTSSGTYKKLLYKILLILEHLTQPLIIRSIPREENQSDALKNLPIEKKLIETEGGVSRATT